MNYFIILTRACNLKCRYCGEDATFESPPIDISYSIDELANFLKKDTSDISIQFYGGEPLIRISLLEKIMDSIPNIKHWTLQTNAINLAKMKANYLKKFSAILASIDGRKKTTDTNRGQGIYDKVLKNCQNIRQRDFQGDLIARMTVSEVADIYEEVVHLASIKEPIFDHIHWQIDSQWDDDPHSRWINFNDWIDNSYNPGITKLVHWWFKKMQTGKFIGLVPFIPIMNSLLFNVGSKIRCGAGLDSFAINPDSSISVCPISPQFEFSVVGNIKTSDPASLKNSLSVKEPCLHCDKYTICGGRCLFINHTKLWGLDAYNKVCGTVKHMISQLQLIKMDILKLIKNGVILKEHFNYPKYNNGCEIIP